MDQFRTEIEVLPVKKQITYSSHLLFIGSCFSENIGSFFEEYRFNSLSNPFGVLYNPASVAKSLWRLLDPVPYQHEDLKYHHDVYHSFDHHSSFSGQDVNDCLKNINESLRSASLFLSKVDFLFITFGTSWIFTHQESGQLVSNCHKYPAKVFNRSRLTVNQIVREYSELIPTLKELNPNMHIVFTVSPVRHWKDGAHENQLSKASLLLAIDELVNLFDDISYFPSYELLMDDLRDYRFYKDDMVHPSNQAIDYVRQKLIASHFDSKAQTYYEQVHKVIQAKNHKPFNLRSKSHQQFLKAQVSKIQSIAKQYPESNILLDIAHFENGLI